ncbi:MAG: glycosyltransferase family 39 protein [Micromonosporaceae bacterium]|nr:glycosyltransferase family 39 protein [Micromonosporaceae bacterium]
MTGWVLVIAGLQFVELMAFAGRYGYHRDEMYFIVAGFHPAAGYPDQPPLVPLVIALMYHLGHSLYLVRLPSALVAAATVVVTALTARDAGGTTRAQVVAAGVGAVSGISLATGHFVTTTTFDVLSTALLGWLLVRAVTRHDHRALLWAGLVSGVGFEAKPQVGFVAAVALVALAIVGPRWVLRSRWLWLGVGLAVVLAAPYLLWQAAHGWPQLTVAGNVAGDAEGGRIGFLPFQLVLVSPVLFPVWIAALVAVWRHRAPDPMVGAAAQASPALRPLRFVAVLYGLVLLAYLVGDGKAYYQASLYPTLVGIGAVVTAGWLLRGWRRVRLGLFSAAVVISALITAAIGLPLLPDSQLPGSAAVALNPDIGEEIGWPQFVDTVAGVWNGLPPADRAHAVIFTGNYGEAAAIDLLGGPAGLPPAYSGHNGYSLWGQPGPDKTTTIVLGADSVQQASRAFTGCVVAARISNPVGLHNDEYGGPVLRCSGLVVPWSQLWPQLRHYD